jgi:hypothetical protein
MRGALDVDDSPEKMEVTIGRMKKRTIGRSPSRV